MRFGLKERMLMEIGVFPPNMNSDGGPGSGNHGHKGVPGKVGGSAPSKSENHTLSEVSDKIPSSALHPEYVYGSKIFGGVVDEDVGTEARKAFKSSNAPPARKTFKLSDLKTDQIVNRTSDIRKMIELCPSYNDVVALSSKDPIKVVRHKGNNILIDGNTRASVAKIYGINEIPVDFYDLDSDTKHGDGGPGSGNFEHEGRPGKIGGSAPSDNPKSESAKANRKEFLTNAMEKFSAGEGLQVKDSELPEYTVELRKSEYGYYINNLSGEAIEADDILNSGRFSDIKTLKEVHDEKTKFVPKFKTKEEYQVAKKKELDSVGGILDEINADYQKYLQKINDEYGNRYELRNSVLSDNTLSDDEKKTKLQEIDSLMREKEHEIVDLDFSFDDIRENYTSGLRNIYEPEYEYKHISSPHDIADDCKKEIVNPNGLDGNCQRCAVAFELRQRGYDVQASDGESGGLATFFSIADCFENADTYKADEDKYTNVSIYDIQEKMKEWGDYSRAIICASSSEIGSGHAFNLYQKGDETIAIDAQNGIEKPLIDYWYDNLTHGEPLEFNSVRIVRTDNAPLKYDAGAYVKERTDEK